MTDSEHGATTGSNEVAVVCHHAIYTKNPMLAPLLQKNQLKELSSFILDIFSNFSATKAN